MAPFGYRAIDALALPAPAIGVVLVRHGVDRFQHSARELLSAIGQLPARWEIMGDDADPAGRQFGSELGSAIRLVRENGFLCRCR